MFLRSIDIRNFRSLRESKVSFLGEDGQPAKSIAITGPNGSGKSTLAHAIMWNLCGSFPSEFNTVKKEDIYPAGQQDITVRVSLEWEVASADGGRIKFSSVRKQAPKKGKVSLEVTNLDTGEKFIDSIAQGIIYSFLSGNLTSDKESENQKNCLQNRFLGVGVPRTFFKAAATERRLMLERARPMALLNKAHEMSKKLEDIKKKELLDNREESARAKGEITSLLRTLLGQAEQLHVLLKDGVDLHPSIKLTISKYPEMPITDDMSLDFITLAKHNLGDTLPVAFEMKEKIEELKESQKEVFRLIALKQNIEQDEQRLAERERAFSASGGQGRLEELTRELQKGNPFQSALESFESLLRSLEGARGDFKNDLSSAVLKIADEYSSFKTREGLLDRTQKEVTSLLAAKSLFTASDNRLVRSTVENKDDSARQSLTREWTQDDFLAFQQVYKDFSVYTPSLLKRLQAVATATGHTLRSDSTVDTPSWSSLFSQVSEASTFADLLTKVLADEESKKQNLLNTIADTKVQIRELESEAVKNEKKITYLGKISEGGVSNKSDSPECEHCGSALSSSHIESHLIAYKDNVKGLNGQAEAAKSLLKDILSQKDASELRIKILRDGLNQVDASLREFCGKLDHLSKIALSYVPSKETLSGLSGSSGLEHVLCEVVSRVYSSVGALTEESLRFLENTDSSITIENVSKLIELQRQFKNSNQEIVAPGFMKIEADGLLFSSNGSSVSVSWENVLGFSKNKNPLLIAVKKILSFSLSDVITDVESITSALRKQKEGFHAVQIQIASEKEVLLQQQKEIVRAKEALETQRNSAGESLAKSTLEDFKKDLIKLERSLKESETLLQLVSSVNRVLDLFHDWERSMERWKTLEERVDQSDKDVTSLKKIKALLAPSGAARNQLIMRDKEFVEETANKFMLELDPRIIPSIRLVSAEEEGSSALDVVIERKGEQVRHPSFSQGGLVELVLELALARLAPRPGFLIYDEPEKGLDEENKAKLASFFSAKIPQAIMVTNAVGQGIAYDMVIRTSSFT
jgi:DNA repair exonuclease SbcCD ATPase subunit